MFGFFLDSEHFAKQIFLSLTKTPLTSKKQPLFINRIFAKMIFKSAIPSLINGYPMQITGMSIKNVKSLFLIPNQCNCIDSNGIKQQLLLSRKFIWKYCCQRILKRRVWPIIWLFDVMNLSNFLLMSILMCKIYWKLQWCME